jgi:two-component system OmpR family sensor kinase
MRLRVKIILICSLATGTVAMASGAVAAVATWNNAISTIDNKLDLLAENACASGDPLGNALLQLEALGTSTEVGFFSINKDFSVLGDTEWVIKLKPGIRQLRLASQHAMTIETPGAEAYRLRTCAMPDKEYLVFATSLKDAKDNTFSYVGMLSAVAASTLVLGALALWALTRRDLRRIEYLINQARRISTGDFATQLEVTRGKSELDALNNSLSNMVESMKAALNGERDLQQKMKIFIADASHELRTPLTLIRGYTELAFDKRQLDAEVIERSKDRIFDQIERMQALVNDLLLLAEIEHEKPRDVQQINFSSIVLAAAADLQALHPNRKIETIVELETFVEGSETYLSQLLANIISNLSRHVDDDRKVVFQLRQNSDSVILQVDDAGSGLPESAYTENVQRFGRFDNSRSRASGGSGLGLSIMAAIVEQHGGRFKMSRSELGGLCTEISLPRASKTPN